MNTNGQLRTANGCVRFRCGSDDLEREQKWWTECARMNEWKAKGERAQNTCTTGWNRASIVQPCQVWKDTKFKCASFYLSKGVCLYVCVHLVVDTHRTIKSGGRGERKGGREVHAEREKCAKRIAGFGSFFTIRPFFFLPKMICWIYWYIYIYICRKSCAHTL